MLQLGHHDPSPRPSSASSSDAAAASNAEGGTPTGHAANAASAGDSRDAVPAGGAAPTAPPTLTATTDRGAWPDPARDRSPLGVLVRFTAPPRPAEPGDDDGDGDSRRPLAVSLVIDRSGSMSGPPVEAAKEAAIRLQEHLAASDRRAVVAFDTEIDLLAPLGPAVADDATGRDRLARDTAAIRGLFGRGGTALSEGWRRGSHLLEEANLPADADAITVVLSDGMGNRGVTHPAELHRLAAAAASWGVRTTCVGIGRRYSTPQLEALSEGGEGSLHQASEPDEIVECVLGELGRVRSIAARDVRLEITVPGGLDALIVGGRRVEADRFDHAANARRYEVRLGDVAGEHAIEVGVLLTRVLGAAAATELHFDPLEVVARWTCPVTGETREAVLAVPPGGNSAAAADEAGGPAPGRGLPLPTGVEPRLPRRELATRRDVDVAAVLLRLWHAWLVREATLRNEDGDFEGAARFVERHLRPFRDFARGIEGGQELLRTLHVTGRRVRSRWEGRSKKELMVMSRKFARGEVDPRAMHDAADYGAYVDRED